MPYTSGTATQTGKQMDKAYIQNLLMTDKRAIARAVVVLTSRQTSDEQASEHTHYLNGRGFRPCHAKMGTSHAKFFQRTGFLTEKQINYWRVKMACGNTRIGIYWAQLLEEAQEKAHLRAIATRVLQQTTQGVGIQPNTRDLGNDMERKVILQYELGMVMDSDDENLITPIQAEIDEIDAFWKKLRTGR